MSKQSNNKRMLYKRIVRHEAHDDGSVWACCEDDCGDRFYELIVAVDGTITF